MAHGQLPFSMPDRAFDLYFLSSPQSRHSRDLAVRPTVAATVHEDYADWREIKGIQLEGTVEQLSGTDQTRARELYGAKFPFAASAESTPAAIVAALARVRWYRLVASRAYFIDNSAGFGHRDQVF